MKEKILCFFIGILLLVYGENVFAERERFTEENGRIVIEAENYHRHSRMGV